MLKREIGTGVDKMIKSYFFKLLHSPYFYAGMMCVLGLCVFSSIESLDTGKGLNGADTYTDMQILLGLKGYRRAFIIFGAIPFAANFADEWNSKTITNCVTRKSVLNYAVSNAVVCFGSSILSVFIPMAIFVTGLSFGDKDFYSEQYNYMLVLGMPYLTMLIFLLTFSLCCAMWSVTGMMLSAFFPSKYVALGTPFVLSAFFEHITLVSPWWFDLMGLSVSYTGKSAAASFGYAFLVFAGLSAVCGAIFVLKVGKKVQNELS